jgi:hypothetical protein
VKQTKLGHVSCVSAEMTKRMLVVGQGNYGLALEIGGSSGNPYLTHGGINEGFEGVLVAYPRSGDGAVVMTNAQGGQLQAYEVVRSIASVSGWPDFHPILRTTVNIKQAPATSAVL